MSSSRGDGDDARRVGLLAIASAFPSHVVTQREMTRLAGAHVDGHRRIIATFDRAGVEVRHIVRPVEWYLEEHDWPERSHVYESTALDLLADAATKCLDRAGVRADEVDAIVLVSSTGVSIPSLDARLAMRLPFRRNVERTPIFGLGCSGGVSGFARAADLARVKAGRTVLLVIVEVCSVNLSRRNLTAGDVVSFALFGDGACAALLRSDGRPATPGPASLARLGAAGEQLWPGTEDLARIVVRSDSLAPVLSPDLPPQLRERIAASVDEFLRDVGRTRADLAGYLIHPGAAKLLDAQREELGLAREALRDSYEVLRVRGNVSAASVGFVLEAALARGARGLHLMVAPGPGLHMSYLLVDLGG